MSKFVAEPHPFLFPNTQEEADALYEQTVRAGPVKHAEYATWLERRTQLIANAISDPLGCGFELQTWTDTDIRLRDPNMLVAGIFGGNRAGKSKLAAKRVVESAMYRQCIIACLSEKEETSIATQQKLIWEYIEKPFGHLNGKRDKVYKINRTQANGFADRKIVLPNGSEIVFLTYKQEATDYEGWQFGAQLDNALVGLDEPMNIGAWADESLSVQWLEVLIRRCGFFKSKLLWTFTPVRGITPAVKQFLGNSFEVLESKPAELLPDANIPGCPRGSMPYVVKPYCKNAFAIYFHSILNPFGNFYPEIKRLCAGKVSEFTERVAYGWARDSASRAHPKFTAFNVVKQEHLPALGTNYMFCDPADTRPFSVIWVRVTPGDTPDYYIYRDWPDEATYGEWAIPTEKEVNEERSRGRDGDPGPAQNPMGYGCRDYKREWLELERIHIAEPPALWASLPPEQRDAALKARHPDPYRRALAVDAISGGHNLNDVREWIEQRFIDSRAGPREHVLSVGGTCIIDQMNEQHVDAETGAVLVPAMDFDVASGERIQLGVNIVNDLLDWDDTKPMQPLVNSPRLFVAENCRQVIWTLSNYTGLGGEKGACKDFEDLIRYMALGQIWHVSRTKTRPYQGGSY